VAAPCYPGTYTGDCKTYNKSNCGVQYSDQQNAAYCAIDTPSTWPPLLQVCGCRVAAGEPPAGIDPALVAACCVQCHNLLRAGSCASALL
jgi:hypothetical protein